MKKFLLFANLFILVFSVSLFAQIRPVEDEKDEPVKEEKEKKNESKAEAKKSEEEKPESQKYFDMKFAVKYQGGLIGYSKKEHGTIGFEQINERIIFYGKDNKEKFSIPYKSIITIYPSQKKVRAGTGRVVGATPLPGASILGSLIKKKKNYMVVQFDDPDVNAKGTINFLLDTEELLKKAITASGENAELKKRGDAYIKKKDF